MDLGSGYKFEGFPVVIDPVLLKLQESLRNLHTVSDLAGIQIQTLTTYLATDFTEPLDLKVSEMLQALQAIHNAIAYTNSTLLIRKSKNLVN